MHRAARFEVADDVEAAPGPSTQAADGIVAEQRFRIDGAVVVLIFDLVGLATELYAMSSFKNREEQT